MLLSVTNDCQSNVIDGRLLLLLLSLLAEAKEKRDLMPGTMASFQSDRVVQGTVSDGQSTFPFRREGME